MGVRVISRYPVSAQVPKCNIEAISTKINTPESSGASESTNPSQDNSTIEATRLHVVDPEAGAGTCEVDSCDDGDDEGADVGDIPKKTPDEHSPDTVSHSCGSCISKSTYPRN